jgi:putative oxidoreductase
MSALSIGLAVIIRVVLVLLFLPFSALDKVLDFRSAVAQAEEALPNKVGATGLILVGLFVEVFMSAGVVSGVVDRACAFVLAGYCAVTALAFLRTAGLGSDFIAFERRDSISILV